MDDQECSNPKTPEKCRSFPVKEHRFHCHIDPAFLANFIWVLVLGVGILYWIGSYTSQLQTVVGLLGLGGIFAWAAFFFNLIRQERKNELQLMFDELLRLRATSAVLLICTGVVFVTAWNFGCITIDSSRDTLDRWIEIRRVNTKTPSCSADLRPRLNAKFPTRSGFKGRDYEIDVEGLPIITRRVGPFSHVRLRAPGDFLRRSVVLVRPSSRVSTYSSQVDADHVLSVRVDGNDMGEVPFRGQAVWVGSGKPLQIPSLLKEKWRIELEADRTAPASTLLRWLEPDVYVEGGIRGLRAGQKLEVEIRARGATEVFAYGSDIVRACSGEQDFPQILEVEQKR